MKPAYFFRLLIGTNSIGSFLRITTLKRRLRCYLPLPVTRVLEAGCGSGIVLAKLRPLFPSAELVGFDIDDKSLANARRRIPHGRFTKEDLTKYKGDGRFDLVFNVDVLEHIENHHAALRGMSSALRTGGILAIHTPNEIQRRLLHMAAIQQHEQFDHVREGFDLDGLCADLEAEGLEIVHRERTVGTWGAFLWEVDFLLRKLRPLNFVFLPVLKLLVLPDIGSNNPQGNGLLIIARKR